MFEKISVIIITYNRLNSLIGVLDDLAKQTYFPSEVIIVDQTPNDSVKEALKQWNVILPIKYVFQKQPSSAIARNNGVKNSSKESEIVMFLDDDMRIDPKYIEEIVKVFREFDAYGVGGYIKPSDRIMHRIIRPIFYGDKYLGRVIIPTEGEILRDLKETKENQWLSGGTMSYKKVVFDKLNFDEKLKRWSYKDDMDFSYRVHKEFGKLYITPHAKIVHLSEHTAKIPKPYEILMKLSYRLYFSKKNHFHSFKNSILFWWSIIGTCILEISVGVGTEKTAVGKLKRIAINLMYCKKSLIYILLHYSEICNGTDPYLFNI